MQLGDRSIFLVKADNVEKMSYLRLMGGIPIDPTSTAGSLAAMEEAAAWLDGPGKLRVLCQVGGDSRRDGLHVTRARRLPTR